MCIITKEGNRAVTDCVRCGLGLGSPKCINSMFKALAGLEFTPTTIRYEEEVIVNLDEERTRKLMEYISFIRDVERVAGDNKFYGLPQDDMYYQRRELVRRVLDGLYSNPLISYDLLDSYKESYPERSIFLEAYQRITKWVSDTKKRLEGLWVFQEVRKRGDLQKVVLGLLKLTGVNYISSSRLPLPDGATLVATYEPTVNVVVEIYQVPTMEDYVYVTKHKLIENLSEELKDFLAEKIRVNLKELDLSGDPRTIFEDKVREVRMSILDEASEQGLEITGDIANAMAHEIVSWAVGLGSPIELIAKDDKVNDVYIDSQNSPIYIEHAEYGVCRTLWRYSLQMIDRVFSNIILFSTEHPEFDEKHPVADVVLKRLNMRCHLQRPPATFSEYQAALRLMRTQPFTYPLYLKYKSMTPFFAGYDDLMVNLGSSEGVLGLKSSGKTSFVSAKIAAIGTSRRILPLQDIEEIPVTAYRKRGFHIGSVRVQSSERELPSGLGSGGALDLVTMANAALRMGDACVIINEIRSRLAIQGVINLLNTQPGVFLLYNLHAQSLRDVQDRLELVFGIPATSMFSTDRYTVLKKIRFGRKTRLYRVIGNAYESDPEEHRFVEVFTFHRGPTIDECRLVCNFLENPEASSWRLDGLDLGQLQDNLKFKYVPPVLARRCEEVGFTPEQAIMQAFFKAKMYYDIYYYAEKLNDPQLLELDFVLKCNTAANDLLREMEDETGSVDYHKLAPVWEKRFRELLVGDRKSRGLDTDLSLLRGPVSSGSTPSNRNKNKPNKIRKGDNPRAKSK